MLFYKLICLFLSFIIIIIHGKDISSTKKLLKSVNLNNKIKKGRERYGGIYNSKYMTIEKRRKYNYIKKQNNNNNSYFSYCNVYKNNDVNNNYTAYNYYINNPKNKLKEYYEKIKNHVIKKKKKIFSLKFSQNKRNEKKKKYFFINCTSFHDIKDNIKVLFNIDYIENNIIYSYIKSFKRTPPITKIYLLGTFLLSVLIHINKNVYKLILFDFNKIFKKGEIWRLFTPYFYIGNLYLQYILMFNYLNIYMSSVEISHYKKPEDFLIFLTFGYISNLLFTIWANMYNENIMNVKLYIHNFKNLFIKDYISKYRSKSTTNNNINSNNSSNNRSNNNHYNNSKNIDIKKEQYNHLGYVFSTYILYYWSRINEGTLINCFELFFIKAEYVPFFFIIQNILLYNEFSLYEVASIFSSYLFFTYEKYFKFNYLRLFFKTLLKAIRIYPLYDRYKEEYE
ncbi:DER1-like protein [Plasmodium reichenowi]|uniref:Derlin n=1 Tax=Plasmodium reichenowi TaxID=5854 RepID=A0A151LTY2_PLARE|nr:DER1-like protein [Plasmodium reichenowi]KYO02635.1 DER1-like protein [Plasmodium reichenowi]